MASLLLTLTGLLLVGLSHSVTRTPTPPMGWNSYNYYSCYPNETIMQSNAKGLVDLGFAELGYTRVTTDCGWPSKNRTADGQITWDQSVFPSGFPALGEYVHSLGLLFGVYSDAGIWQCDVVGGTEHRQGSLGHESQDAATFASWGMDTLKYDNCWATNTTFVNYDQSQPDPSPRFAAMSDALDGLNRSVELDICEWGAGYNLQQWAGSEANSWRISNDIADNWASIWRIANQVVPYASSTRPGRFPDMDMLIVGLRALSEEEEKFHFALWATSKSLLTIGAPMDTSLTPASSLAILSNKDVIALNQDPLGEQVALVRRYTEEQYDIWAGNLTGGKIVVVTNWSNDTNPVAVDLASILGLQSASSITDVWAGTNTETSSLQMNLSLAGHEARLLKLSGVEYAAPPAPGSYYSAAQATLAGGADVESCAAGTCQPTTQAVRNVVNGAKVTFENVSVGDASSTKLVGVDFINYDIALPTGTNTRNLTLAVNGAAPKRWAFPISGGDWSATGRLNIEVDGFKTGTNVLTLAALEGEDGPDVVGIEVF